MAQASSNPRQPAAWARKTHRALHGTVLILLGWGILTLAGCKKEEAQPPVEQKQAAVPIASKPVPTFDAEQTMKDAATQVNFGARVPNTDPHEKEVAWLKEQLSALTPDVQLQTFTSPAYDGPELRLTNILASFNPAATNRILLLAHFDSRPWADEDPNPKNQTKPVPAANDGASGVAVLLGVARALKASAPPIGVDILMDDGEDYGKYKVDSLNRYFLGVKHFVSVMPPNYHPRFAILLDMVGDKSAQFKMEGFSLQEAGEYTQEVWHVAEALHLSHFKMEAGGFIEDDHLPLLGAHIPSVDLIDGDLVGHVSSDPARKYWHTVDDTMAHLSAETMGQVGQLLLQLIYDRLPRDLVTLP